LYYKPAFKSVSGKMISKDDGNLIERLFQITDLMHNSFILQQ